MSKLTEQEERELRESIQHFERERSEPSRAKHKPTVQAIAEEMAAFFEKLIEQAPDGPEEIEQKRSAPSLVRVANGWGEKYLTPIESNHEKWNRYFEEVKKIVANSGLVALIQNRGTGKTQMAAEIARAGYWPTDRGEWNGNAVVGGKTALYRRAMDVFIDLRAASDAGKGIIEKLSNVGLLVVDEFQERGETPFEDRMMTSILDRRYAGNKPTILISNHEKAGLVAALSPSVRDRMTENGKAYIFDWPSFRRVKP